MAIKYDKNVDYQAEINKAVARGDYASAKVLEQQRNAKIAGEGIKDYSMTTIFQNYNPSPAASSPAASSPAASSPAASSPAASSPAASSPVVSSPIYIPKTPSYMTSADMAKNLGIDYNYQNILDKLNKATEAEYALKNKEYAMTENQFYNQMYGAQGTALDTIRKSQAQAIATGASRGLQSANELAAMLGLQQETVASATDLAQQRNMLKDKEAGAYTQNVVNATDTYNTLGTTLGNLINNKYAADVQHNVGLMEYFKGLDQNAKNLEGNMYAADRNLEGTKYTADQNLAGNKYTADQNLAGNKYTADQNLAGVDLTSARNLQGQLDYNQAYLEAIRVQAEATKYAANASAAAQKAYYDSMKAQSPEEIFKLLNNAKTEEEYVLILVGGSQGHIPADMARELWKNRNTKLAKDMLQDMLDDLMIPYNVTTRPQAPDWLIDYDATFGKYYMHK